MEDKRITIEKVTSNPEDTELLTEFPSKQRKIHSDLINGRIVDSGTVQGLKPSNESGQIPINNGNLNKGLNAEKLGGEPKEYFSAATHRHNNVTNDVDGFMSKEDKRKLNTIKENAEENQNAFSGVAVANTITELTTSDNLITAKNKSDAFGLLGSENIKLDLDLSNNVTTIKLNGKVPTASYADNAKKAEKADKINVSNLSEITTELGSVTNGTIKGVRYESKDGKAWIDNDEIHGMKISTDTLINAGYKVKNISVEYATQLPFTELKLPTGRTNKDCVFIRFETLGRSWSLGKPQKYELFDDKCLREFLTRNDGVPIENENEQKNFINNIHYAYNEYESNKYTNVQYKDGIRTFVTDNNIVCAYKYEESVSTSGKNHQKFYYYTLTIYEVKITFLLIW